MQAFLDAVMDVLQTPDLPFSGQMLSSGALRSNVAAYRASVQAASRALQSLLVLIAYLVDVQMLGTQSLPQQKLSQLAHEVAPQVMSQEIYLISSLQKIS